MLLYNCLYVLCTLVHKVIYRWRVPHMNPCTYLPATFWQINMIYWFHRHSKILVLKENHSSNDYYFWWILFSKLYKDFSFFIPISFWTICNEQPPSSFTWGTGHRPRSVSVSEKVRRDSVSVSTIPSKLAQRKLSSQLGKNNASIPDTWIGLSSQGANAGRCGAFQVVLHRDPVCITQWLGQLGPLGGPSQEVTFLLFPGQPCS